MFPELVSHTLSLMINVAMLKYQIIVFNSFNHLGLYVILFSLMCDSMQSSSVNLLHNSRTIMRAKEIDDPSQAPTWSCMPIYQICSRHFLPYITFASHIQSQRERERFNKLSRLSKMSLYYSSSSLTCIASLTHKPPSHVN